jgi:hypothetical protein
MKNMKGNEQKIQTTEFKSNTTKSQYNQGPE